MGKDTPGRRQARLMAGLTAVSALILVCFVGVLAAIRQANRDSHQAQMFAYMTEYRISLRGKLDSDLETLGMMAEILRLNDRLDAELFLDGLVDAREELLFERIGYYARDGSVCRAVLAQGSETARLDQLEPQLRETVERAWAGESSVSPVYFDGSLGRMTLTFAVPVYGPDGEAAGALAGSRSLKAFAGLLNAQTQSGVTLNIDWVGEDGTVLTWSQYSLLPQRIENLLDAQDLPAAGREKLAKLLESGQAGVVEYPVDGGRLPLYIQPLGLNGWSLAFLDGARTSATPVYDMLTAALVILVVLLALCVGGLLASQRALRRANRALEHTARYDESGALRLEPFLELAGSKGDGPGRWCLAEITLVNFEDLYAACGYKTCEAAAAYFGRLIAKSLMEGESFCRVGGCRFALLLAYDRQELLNTRLEGILDELDDSEPPEMHVSRLFFRAGAADLASATGQGDAGHRWRRCAGIALERALRPPYQRVVFFTTGLYEEHTRRWADESRRQSDKDEREQYERFCEAEKRQREWDAGEDG